MPEGEDNSNSLNIQRDEEVERQPHRDYEEYAMTIKLLGILKKTEGNKTKSS